MILATEIKVEDDGGGGGGGGGQADFDGDVASVNQGAGTIMLKGGQVVAVNASTVWDGSGDLFSLAAIDNAMAGGASVEVEGDGVAQADGLILATEIKVEDDGGGGGGGGGQADFDGDVASVNQGAGTIMLKGGQVVAVNASTVWDGSGDLFSLAAIDNAMAGGASVEVEGDGVAQADGSILATEIKAEDND